MCGAEKSYLCLLEKKFVRCLNSANIPLVSYSSRLKKKSSSGGMPDKFGVRCITVSKEDCYSALEELKKEFEAVKIKDYIANPWSCGYSSIHIIFNIDDTFVELQLRTEAMDKKAGDLIDKFGNKYWEKEGYQK